MGACTLNKANSKQLQSSSKKAGETSCTCKKGYGGSTCSIMCPGMSKGVPCSDHGKCTFDTEKGTAALITQLPQVAHGQGLLVPLSNGRAQ